MATKKPPVKAGAKEVPLPPEVTAMVKELFKLGKELKKRNEATAKIAEKEKDMRADLLALFGKKKLDGMKVMGGSVSLVRTTYAVVEDMDALKAAAKKKGNDDLLKVSLDSTAWRSRRNVGVEVPGVREDYREDLRVSLPK